MVSLDVLENPDPVEKLDVLENKAHVERQVQVEQQDLLASRVNVDLLAPLGHQAQMAVL